MVHKRETVPKTANLITRSKIKMNETGPYGFKVDLNHALVKDIGDKASS